MLKLEALAEQPRRAESIYAQAREETIVLMERFTWKLSHLQQKEFIELLKATLETQGKAPHVCPYVFGDRDVVTSDLH
jgi:hypothetical protein